MYAFYITKYTFTGTRSIKIPFTNLRLGGYAVSNPMLDIFDTLPNSGIDLSMYYAPQDHDTQLPKTLVMLCVLEGGSGVDGIQIPGVMQLPRGNKERQLSTLTEANKKLIKNIVQTIDPDVDLTQFGKIGEVIMYIAKSIQPGFKRFGNGYDEGDYS